MPSEEEEGSSFWKPETEFGKLVRDLVFVVGSIAILSIVLYGVAGVWPPFVSVSSGSMEPEMSRGDMIILEHPTRAAPDGTYGDTGIVPVQSGEKTGFTSFNGSGSVIIFTPDGDTERTPIIHRAHFHVDAGEDWLSRANPAYLGGTNITCAELSNCPAPNAGFITKGDNNPVYDQVYDFSSPVKSEWVRAEAKYTVPYLGWVRLILF